MLDIGKMIGRVRLTPVELKDSSTLEGWLNGLERIELAPDAKTDRINERVRIVTEFVKCAFENTVSCEYDLHLLGGEHAF